MSSNMEHSRVHDYNKMARLLHSITNSNVYTKGSPSYNRKRKVHNGLCNNIFPDLIVEPKTTYDVSQIVKIARSNNVPISVRSGGHSYVCSSTRNGKIS